MFFSIFFIIVTFFCKDIHNTVFFINGFDIHSFIGGRVIILYVELNTYLFYMQYMYSPTTEAIEKYNGQGEHAFELAALDVNTNIDELRSVEINFPDDRYNRLEEDRVFQEPDLGSNKKQAADKNKFKDEDVI